MATLTLLTLFLGQVQELDSKDPAVARKAFEGAIKAADEKALEAAAMNSPQAWRALAEVRAHKRFGDAYPPVKLVTFKATDQPLPKFVEDLSKALGIPVEDYHKNRGLKGDEAITLNLVDAYPMEAVDALLREVNAQGWYRGKGFEYTRGWTRKNPHMLHWRHAAFFPYTVEEERSLDAFGAAGAACTMTVIFRHDGASRIVGIRLPRSVEGTDDQGAPVKAGNDGSEPTYYGLGAQGSFKLRLEGLKPGCEKLRLVRGVLPVVIPERRVWKEVPIGAEKTELVLNNMKLTVEKITAPGSTVRVHLGFLDTKKLYVVPEPRDFELQGKDGTRLPATGSTDWKIMNGVMELAFDLPVGFTATALRVGSYETFGEHEIPFEFRDVRVR